MEAERFAVTVTGIVQGVGFRPYIYKLAGELGLAGWILNSPGGVELEIEGKPAACAAFLARLKPQAPPAARVENIIVSQKPPLGERGFSILPSREGPRQTLIPADLAICPACLAELFEPTDRRYRYPFINCTDCGPRFTIIEGLPYDRPLTTMKSFPLCDTCSAEYRDPLERRFHAQPNACAACGPRLLFCDNKGQAQPAGEPLALAQAALKNGRVLAVKGLGGYHLACDATDETAVATLRARKRRWGKPFALMLPNLERARHYCLVNAEEEALLTSRRRPILLLRQNAAAQKLAPSIAPGQKRLGVMLPYTPLHYLLIEGFSALVMTSANISDEPIVYEDGEALARLSGLADFFLLHNRPIFRRADDSVAVFAAHTPRLIRRSRGYAPEPLKLPGCNAQILAVGAQEKNTFCLTRGPEAFLSQHLGELDDFTTYQQFRREIEHFCAMFHIEPTLAACDMHPDYASTRYAKETGLPLIPVQHHHAHLASVLAEHAHSGPALGLIFDGTGYGLDGNLWGGEVLHGDCAAFTRLAHLRYLPLPGGEAAIREPWRAALSALHAAAPDLVSHPHWRWPAEWPLVLAALQQSLNAPLSSGMGRLFDAIAALCGLHPVVDHEGQAAIALEQILDDSATGCYPLPLIGEVIDWRPLISAVATDILAGASAGAVSARFHRAVSELCLSLARHFGANTVALSGGCWQNLWLLEDVSAKLSAAGFTVLSNAQVPAGDGGIAFGQAAVAAEKIKTTTFLKKAGAKNF